MGIEFLGTVLVGIVALVSAIYTAQQGRKSAAATAAVAEKDSQRDAQLAFLSILSEEVDKLNKQVVAMRDRLNVAEDTADSERTKRRQLERSLAEVIDQVQRLQILLSNIPALVDHPEIHTAIETMLRRRAE